MNKTAIIYVRVSTTDQAINGVSLDAQQAKAAAWAQLHDAEVLAVYSDVQSGSKAGNREGLQAALDHACRTGAALVVYSLSRLARSTRDAIEIAERLNKAGSDLVSLSEQIDTTSAAGRMVFRMLSVLAEFERDQIAERTRAALAHKKAAGQRVGTVPYGFQLEADGVTLTPNADQQEAVQIIIELRAAGVSMRRIAEELTHRQIPTAKGHSTWTHTTIASIARRLTAA